MDNDKKSPRPMRYRLGIDLGSTSLGWSMVRLDEQDTPCAITKTGVRLFSDGRVPKTGESLAVTRRNARAQRRRRDRLLMRKQRMLSLLITLGFFPQDTAERKALEVLNPYELRARGLDEALTPAEFARALFHLNQRRGFKSNRKTDKKDNDSGALKGAIRKLGEALDPQGREGKARTVGELLWWRIRPEEAGEPLRPGLVRARLREFQSTTPEGKARKEKRYDLYVDRAMVEQEFNALWAAQARFDPQKFNETAKHALQHCLLHQRDLKPVKPGRCTLETEEPRAPLALPSQQRFRIFQEANHLRVTQDGMTEAPLTLAQRNALTDALERNGKRTFDQIRKLLKLPGSSYFNLEDAKRQELKGNSTSAQLSKAVHFGPRWFEFPLAVQDHIVTRLLTEESDTELIDWLRAEFQLDEPHAEAIATAGLAEGYGSFSVPALNRVLPQLVAEVITYDAAVKAAGYAHHSQLSHAATTGEILEALPYYGEYLQRHVSFGSNDPEDPPEKRYGKIANPTVHIGLNQLRVVVNALIRRYGHPSEVVVELARDLKQSRVEKEEERARQAKNQTRNARLKKEVAAIFSIAEEQVKHADVQKLILWEELSHNVAERRCPYSGVQISAAMALSPEVEIEHILPFSQTLDDSLHNKTLAMRQANRIKGNRTPSDAREDFERQGWSYQSILQRAESMPRQKRYRFGPDGYKTWLREDKDFVARALNDTRYLSRIAREYLSLICPGRTRVIPGQMTALLRARFGLNSLLGLQGEKNRDDHRHHAIDACVIAVTDQGMLQKFAQASASARTKQLDRLVETMPLPWPSYREHVARAVRSIKVSHRPDHSHEGAMMEATAYGLNKDGSIRQKRREDGSEGREIKHLIRLSEPRQPERHGVDAEGNPLPYVGYVGGSNYCIEIVRDAKGNWRGDVITTYEAYRLVATAERRLRQEGLSAAEAKTQAQRTLRQPGVSRSGQPLIMRLMIGDCIRIDTEEASRLLRVVKIDPSTNIVFADIHEAGDLITRHKDPLDAFRYVNLRGNSLRSAKARQVTLSPIGELHDPGFRE